MCEARASRTRVRAGAAWVTLAVACRRTRLRRSAIAFGPLAASSAPARTGCELIDISEANEATSISFFVDVAEHPLSHVKTRLREDSPVFLAPAVLFPPWLQ